LNNYNALRIALYVIKRYMENSVEITNLKLQKVLYYIQQGFLIKRNGNACFLDQIEAWKYGPVVPSVYNIFSASGASGIKLFSLLEDEFLDISEPDRRLLNEIIDKDLHTNVWHLVNKSHRVGGAWEQIFNNLNTNIIPLNLIREDI